MRRTFIATILAAAVAVTGFSAPARAASGEDIAKILAGAAAVVIIGKAIKDRNDRRDERERVARHDNRWQQGHGHGRRNEHYGRPGQRHHNAGPGRHNGHRASRALPQECHVRVRTPQGAVSGYGYRCIQRDQRLAARLPGQCVMATRSHGGPRFIYTTRCLQRAGFRAS